jgi:acid phosphatase
VRAAVLINRLRGTEALQIKALAARWASARGYLHIGSRPAVFVALADRAQRDCAAARRWRAAAAGFWLAQGTFAGYERCRGAANAWFSDHARAAGARAPGTFLIRPRFRPKHANKSQLRHSLRTWRHAVARMNASGARLQLINSLNGWGNRTAIGPSSAWRSRSRFGRYLDALHAHSPRHVRRADLPTVGALAPAGVTSHSGSLTVTVSADSARSRWWVEFGPTAAYGETTAPVALPVGRAPRAATANLGVLAAGTTYHARVVAASPAGVVASPDAVITTPPDAVAVVQAPAAKPTGTVEKVLVFVEENHSLDQMKAGMPFLYSQAQQYGYATAYTAITHPSLPNYLAMAFGSTFGVTDDGSPASHPEAGPDVFTATIQAGRTARSYQESMTSNCALSNQGSYAVKHNPWAYASSPAARAACAAGDVPSGTSTAGALHDDIVSGGLPNVGEVTPNLANDAHDGSLATADSWLHGWLTLIYASPDWKSGHLAVIITADEDAHNQGNLVLTTVIHPSLAARAVTTPLTHYSLTQLLAQVGHAPCIGSGCGAPSLASAFGLTIG